MKKERASYVGAPHFFNLNQACLVLNSAFPGDKYLVGSSLEKRDYRDVDVRTIMDDDEFKRLFPQGGYERDPFWSIICASMSLWLSQHSGLPVDYQIQGRTFANDNFPGGRCALGIFTFKEPYQEQGAADVH